MSKNDEEADGFWKKVVIGERIPEGRHREIEGVMDRVVTISFMFQKSDRDKHGLTSGCNGRRAIIAGVAETTPFE